MKTITVNDHPFSFPENLEGCVMGVLGGEYAFPRLPDEPPVNRILDLGANVGAFAVWAHQRWPSAEILCYEPHPEAFDLLVKNTEHLPEITCHRQAVVSTATAKGNAKHARLYEGTDWGYNSLIRDLNPRDEDLIAIEVPLIHACDLPACDVLKIDIEGNENGVLSWYGKLEATFAILLEWHTPSARKEIESLLEGFRATLGVVLGGSTLNPPLRLFRSEHLIDCQGRQCWARSLAKFDKRTGKYVLESAKP